MTDFYSIKYSNGSQGYEVQGPDKEWVDKKAESLQSLLEVTPPVHQSPPPSNEEKSQPPKKTVKSSTAKTTPKKRTSALTGLLAAQWTDELPAKIDAFVTERKSAFDSGTTKQAAILAVYLKDELKIETFVEADFELIYRKLGWNTINHGSQLGNARTRDKYFTSDNGVFTLTYAGIQYGRDGAKKPVEKK